MTDAENQLPPAEIRAIRTRLGLTQAEAGELIGGGPRAFTKYEAGRLTPAASVVKLLRLLDANPRMLSFLAPRKPLPTAAGTLSPFEVSGDHVVVLTKEEVPALLRRLLHVEAHEHGLPADGIHVPSNIDAQDGGEDGRIEWLGGPGRTEFLPHRFSQFQVKTGAMRPAEAGKSYLTKDGQVKGMVRSALESGAHHIMLCGERYAKKAIGRREASIRKTLRGAGVAFSDGQVHCWDADQIAGWVNRYPSVAMWLKERTAPGTVGPFRSWNHWAGRSEHDELQWVEDERVSTMRFRLLEAISKSRSAIRVLGLPGVGKTRLVLEALGPDTATDARSVVDFVLYVTLSEAGAEPVMQAARILADYGQRAILVVDDCDTETHNSLAGIASHVGSGLSLITIDSEPPDGTQGPATIEVEEASSAVIEAIVGQLLPGLPSEDRVRLVLFSRGFPGTAVRVGQAWNGSLPLAHAEEEALVNAFVVGRQAGDGRALIDAAQLLATFGLVGLEPPADEQLAEIAAFTSGLSTEEFYAACTTLADRGVAQRRGRTLLLRSDPVSMKLAERRWRAWQPTRWDYVLAGGASPNLKVQAARRLAVLNTTDIAFRVVEHVCREGGPLEGMEAAREPGHSQVLSALAEISPRIVATRIERVLDEAGDLQKVDGEMRREFVEALEKIALHADTFEEGALLLLRLATAENEMWSNNATGKFTELFPVLLGNTAAGGSARLALLERAAATDDPARRRVVVAALAAGSETVNYQRTMGAESQGSRPAIEPWFPPTNADRTEYISECIRRLGDFAEREDEAGGVARAELSGNLPTLVRDGFIELVESVVPRVATAIHYWPHAAASLRGLLAYDAGDIAPGLVERIETLLEELQPKSLDARVRSVISNVQWDFHGDEDLETQSRRAAEAVHALAEELIVQPEVLDSYLSEFSRGGHRMAWVLGKAIADLSDGSDYWLGRVLAAATDVPDDERDFELLSGYVSWLAANLPDAAEAVKFRAAQSPDLAPALPQVCIAPIIAAPDIQLATRALLAGLLPPQRLSSWAYGGVLRNVPASTVAPLFDAMLTHSAEGFAGAIHLMAMYAFGDESKLDGLRAQVVGMAENAGRWEPTMNTHDQTYHFDRIMNWMLAHGRHDRDASRTALALAGGIVDAETLDIARRAKPLVPTLLEGFPEVVWPLIGQAIVSGRRRAARVELLLGDSFSLKGRKNPPVLHLPEDTLFAWCHAHPNQAPAFAAKIVPVLTIPEADSKEVALHPWTARLLDEFGEREDVQQAIERNVHTFGWIGSRATYYEQYEEPLGELSNHSKPAVQRWARTMQRRLRASIQMVQTEDEEAEAQWEV